MSDNLYRGWRNYETWNVALWLDSDEGMQTLFAERAQELLNETDDSGDIYERRNDASLPLADELETFITDTDMGMPDLPNSMYSDLLNHALDCVGWREIADHYLSDIEVQS